MTKITTKKTQLQQIVRESVDKFLKEIVPDEDYEEIIPLYDVLRESVDKILKENVHDEDYEEIIPLYDIFRNGFMFDEYHREQILLDTSLYYPDGRELGLCLNDLCLKYKPNKKR